MRKFVLGALFAIYEISLFGQVYEVPKNYSLIKAEDYAVYEQDVLKSIDWLTGTPIDQNVEKRKEAHTFLLKWITGSPDVKIEIRQEVVNFLPNPDLLMAFLTGWTKYSLETRNFSNSLKGNVAGIENVIFVYKKNKKKTGKIETVEEYIKLKSKGKLEQELAKRIGM